MEIEPMDQFIVEPMGANATQMALVWLDVSISVAQLSILALCLTAIPLWRALPRVGVSKWWALTAAFPPAAIVLIWLVGFRPLHKME